MKKILIVIFIAFSYTLNAQNNEIGVGNSLVYIINEKDIAYGLHVHYINRITNQFGIGIGYERIFNTHQHNTVGVVTTYNPVGGLIIGLSPGITFEDKSPNINFSLHFETAYEFEMKHFCLGPVIGFAWGYPNDYHLGIGIHIGYEF